MPWASLQPLNAMLAPTHLFVPQRPIPLPEEADSTSRSGLCDQVHRLDYKAGFESLASIKKKKTSSAFPLT